MSARGYFGIGIINTKAPMNIGTLWRSAYIMGAAFVFTVGRRYDQQASDTIKATRHIPLYHYVDFEHFNESRPHDCPLVGIEQTEASGDLRDFAHPERAIYLLGAEDHGISKAVLARCQHVVHINTGMCLNVAVAGSIIMYDRSTKAERHAAKGVAA